MIATELKPIQEIIDKLSSIEKIFLIGCGDCATVCKTGSLDQLMFFKEQLEKNGKNILGFCIPESTCVSAKLKLELAKNIKVLKDAQAIIVFACGLGVQSVKNNDRFNLQIFPACNSIGSVVLDAKGNAQEKCSNCGKCMLELTAAICPVTNCSKGLLNGPCGGMTKGKCEIDKNRDCAWVLIYLELEKIKKIEEFKKINKPRDFSKALKPRKLELNK